MRLFVQFHLSSVIQKVNGRSYNMFFYRPRKARGEGDGLTGFTVISSARENTSNFNQKVLNYLSKEKILKNKLKASAFSR